MPAILAENLSLSIGGNTLFENVSFTLNEGEVLAVVGDNGVGKSSLLSCLRGENEPDSGRLNISNALSKISFVSQDLPHVTDESVYTYLLSALSEEEQLYSMWKVDVALQDIHLPEEWYNKKVSELSGGWKRLVQIARGIVTEPDILIMDEPTNHLDLSKVLFIEKWIKNIKIPVIIVSHDRAFLDNVSNTTLTLRGKHSLFYALPFSKAREALYEKDIADAKARQLEEIEINRLRKAAQRIKVWNKYGNADLDKRVKAINKRAEMIESKKTEVYSSAHRDLSLEQSKNRSKRCIDIENLNISSPSGAHLFHIPHFTFNKGDRVVLLGANGTGKTTLLKKILKAYNTSDEQGIKINPQVLISYFDQELNDLNAVKNKDLVDFLCGRTKLNQQQAISELSKAGFRYTDLKKKMSSCSQGQLSRLKFLEIKHSNANFFIFDEPTNHLDISGQEQLEAELIEKEHMCLFVSHDRRFIENIATRYLYIDKNKVFELNQYATFLEKEYI